MVIFTVRTSLSSALFTLTKVPPSRNSMRYLLFFFLYLSKMYETSPVGALCRSSEDVFSVIRPGFGFFPISDRRPLGRSIDGESFFF